MSKWAHDGFDVVAFGEKPLVKDILEDPVLGKRYRVKIASSYEVGAKELSIGDATKANMDLSEVFRCLCFPETKPL